MANSSRSRSPKKNTPREKAVASSLTGASSLPSFNTGSRLKNGFAFSSTLELFEIPEQSLRSLLDYSLDEEGEPEFSDNEILDAHLSHKLKIERAERENRRGNYSFKGGDYLKAITHFSHAISIVPTNVVYVGNRAATFMMSSKYLTSLSDWKTAASLTSFTSEPELHQYSQLLIAKCQMELGELLSAQQTLLQLLQIDPNDPIALKELEKLSRIMVAMEKVIKAKKEKDWNGVSKGIDSAVTKMDQTPPEWKLLKVQALLELKEFSQAKERVRVQLVKHPNEPNTFCLSALFHFYSGNTSQARSDLASAIRLDPDHSAAKELLNKIQNQQ